MAAMVPFLDLSLASEPWSLARLYQCVNSVILWEAKNALWETAMKATSGSSLGSVTINRMKATNFLARE